MHIVSIWAVLHKAKYLVDTPFWLTLLSQTHHSRGFSSLSQDTPLEIHRKIEDLQERNERIHVHNNKTSQKNLIILFTFKEESVVGVPSRVLLRLEESIKVPEGALNEVIGGHLWKSGNDTFL